MRKIYVNNDVNRTFDSDNVVEHYCDASDMTFLTYEDNGKVEVVGFYWGEPSEIATEEYIGYLKAVV